MMSGALACLALMFVAVACGGKESDPAASVELRDGDVAPAFSLRGAGGAEYALAVRELLGIDVDVAAFLPPDTISHGFDNVADAQGFSPSLVRKSVKRERRFPAACFTMTAMEFVSGLSASRRCASVICAIARSA